MTSTLLGRKPDFLLGFAQSGRLDARILRLDTPARKADLAGMVF